MTFLPLEQITPGNNDRKTFPESEIRELAESIAAHGLAQPVTVRPVRVPWLQEDPFGNVGPVTDGATGAPVMVDGYEIVAGERRYRAHVMLAAEGRTALGAAVGTVECNVKDLSDREASAIMLCENLARADLKPLDEAAGYRSRMDAYSLSSAEVAAWAGVSTFRVNERLRLLDLTPEARKLVESTESGALPIGHAARMSELDANRQALALAAWAESGGTITRAGWGDLVGKLMAEQSQDAMFSADSFLQVADMVAGAAKREPSTKALRRHLQAAVRAMEAAGLEPELCAEIRATWSASWQIAAVKAS
jgi:ParB/RepB/Spo0J family partition protein